MATVFCFSSTGNSLYTAKKISKAIDARMVSMTSDMKKCDDDIIGFVFPCYYWHIPLRVEKFINNLNITNKNAYVFTVITYGSSVMGIRGIVRKLLYEKSVKLSYGMKIKSVENYSIAFKVNDNDKVHQNAERIIDMVISDVKEQKSNSFTSSFFINGLIRSFFPAMKANCDSKFLVSDSCTKCRICEKVCPVNNITIANGKLSFSGKCEHCLGCLHACPQKAIKWNGKPKSFQNRQYLNPNIKLKELMEFNSSK